MRLLESCEQMDADAIRGRTLVDESREAVVVLDDRDIVLLASRRARESIEDLAEGRELPEGVLSGEQGLVPLVVPYDVAGRRERLVYLSREGDLTAYEKVDIRESASVEGNILAPRVAIADGANFRGSIDMRPKEEPAASLGIVDGLRRDTSSPTPDGAPSTFEAVESRRGR